MTKYLISFPGEAMQIADDAEWAQAGIDSRAVIEEAKAAGVYVFAGGLDENVAAYRVGRDGEVIDGPYPGAAVPNGGYAILELPDRAAAIEWAHKLAAACRCPQEVREFMYDPAS